MTAKRAIFVVRHDRWSWRAPAIARDLVDWHVHLGRWTFYVAGESKTGQLLDLAARMRRLAREIDVANTALQAIRSESARRRDGAPGR